MSNLIDRAVLIAGQQYYSSEDRAVVLQAAVELLRRHAPKGLGPALDRAAGGLIYEADRAAIEKVRDGAPLSEAERRVVQRAWKFLGFLSGSAPEPIPEPPPALAKKIAAAKAAWDAAAAEWRAAEAELEALRAQSRRELGEMAGADDGRPRVPWLEYVEAEKRWVARLRRVERRRSPALRGGRPAAAAGFCPPVLPTPARGPACLRGRKGGRAIMDAARRGGRLPAKRRGGAGYSCGGRKIP